MSEKQVPGTVIRNGHYHLKIRLAPHLRPAFGGRDFREGSLRTRDWRTAQDGVVKARAEIDAMDALPPDVLTRVAREVAASPKAGETIRARYVVEHQIAQARKAEAEQLARLPPDQRRTVTEAGGIAALEAQHKRTLDGIRLRTAAEHLTAVDFEEMGYNDLEAAGLESLARVDDLAIAASAAQEAQTLRAVGSTEASPVHALTLTEIGEKFIEVEDPAPGNLRQYRRALKLFAECWGPVQANDLSLAHIRDFHAQVQKLPLANRREVRGLAFHDAIKVADKLDLPRVEAKTVSFHMIRLQYLTKWAQNQGYIARDPWAGWSPPGRSKRKQYAPQEEKSRLPFDPEEVRRIIEHSRATWHPSTIDHWGPILAAYHGFRQEEIAQILTADVTEIDGVPCICITDADPELQGLKNAHSMRTIPLHPAVLDMGFLAAVEARRKATNYPLLFAHHGKGRGRLYERELSVRDRLAEGYSLRFNRRLRTVFKIDDKRKVFHSLRHNWEDCARAAMMPEEHALTLAGRKRGGSAAGYGKGVPVALLRESLRKIDPLPKAQPVNARPPLAGSM